MFQNYLKIFKGSQPLLRYRGCSQGVKWPSIIENKVKIRPEFFYFLVLGKFLGKPRVGGGNKNKNKIQKFPESE